MKKLPRSPQSSPGPRRSFRRILHPDMTPMVGLGFLLVTFFLLAADFNRPTVFQLTMPRRPSPDDAPQHLVCGGALTILLGRNDQICYYYGVSESELDPEENYTDFSSTGLRRLLLAAKQKDENMVVIIKPAAEARYQNIVDALDEMNISGQLRYCLADLTPPDQALLKRHGL
jgi:biopolymer transport protein ExbD